MFSFSEVYNMPIWLRSFHIHRIMEWKKKEKEEYDKASKGQNNSSNTIARPNIDPSSVYNFKK